MNTQELTWKESFLKSPGPKTWKEAIILYFKGVCMGSADIIPGVSGGTIAFIMGIYEDLLTAIQSFNTDFIKLVLQFKLKDALSILHIRFLGSLLFGIASALVTLAHLIHYLLKEQPIPTWSLFLGLIGASVLVVGRNIKNWIGSGALGIIIGTVSGYLIVGMIPVQTPEELWFIFISGIIAICAMILPGISGAFLLLIMGKYEYITGTLKNPFVPENMLIIIVFVSGCAVGITGFSRVLKYLLTKHHNITIAMLTGLMLGSMRKIWPWKETLETTTIRGKEYILREQNIIPQSLDGEVITAIVLVVVGFGLVLVLEKFAPKKEEKAA